MLEPVKPLRIFISYAHADVIPVRKLYDDLRAQGFQVWFDEENLIGGQDWRLEIKNALQESDAVIVCLSATSVSKESFVQAEFSFALERALDMPEGRIFLIPMRLDDCKVPTRLSRYHWVDIFQEDGFERLLKALNVRAQQVAEREHIENERIAHQKAEDERIAQEKSKQERLVREKAENERIALAKAEAEKMAAQKAKQERTLREKEEDERTAKQKSENKSKAREKDEREQSAQLTRTEQKQPTEPAIVSLPYQSLLSLWNPLNYFSLLLWVLAQPKRVSNDIGVYGRKGEERVADRLACILIFLPLILPLFGLGFELLPRSEVAWMPQVYLDCALGLVGIWLLFGLLGDRMDTMGAGVYGTGLLVVIFGANLMATSMVTAEAVFGVRPPGAGADMMFGVVFGVVFGMAVGVLVAVAGVVDSEFGSNESIIAAPSVAFGVVCAVASALATGVAIVVAFFVAFVVNRMVTFGFRKGKPVFLVLIWLILSWLTLVFISFGGLTWLQTGTWPIPIWPFYTG
jgi:hypothetical protein